MLWQEIADEPLLGQPMATRDERAREAALADGSFAKRITRAHKRRFGEAPAIDEATAAGSAAGPEAEGAPTPNPGLLTAEQGLAEATPVPETELRRLARDRAKVIRRHLVEQHAIGPERVFVLETELLSEGDGDDAICRLRATGS
jgi:hypothetical protein